MVGILLIVVVVSIALGALNTTTATVTTYSSGPLSISEYAVCQGFGEPTYYSSMDQDVNFTSYAFGHCFFGFWFSNGRALNTTDALSSLQTWA